MLALIFVNSWHCTILSTSMLLLFIWTFALIGYQLPLQSAAFLLALVGIVHSLLWGCIFCKSTILDWVILSKGGLVPRNLIALAVNTSKGLLQLDHFSILIGIPLLPVIGWEFHPLSLYWYPPLQELLQMLLSVLLYFPSGLTISTILVSSQSSIERPGSWTHMGKRAIYAVSGSKSGTQLVTISLLPAKDHVDYLLA